MLLLRLHGTRTMRIKEPQQEKLTPTEWALDCLFHPVQAASYPLFQVQTTAVIDALELPHSGKRVRDRYSFQELLPAIDNLERALVSVASSAHLRSRSSFLDQPGAKIFPSLGVSAGCSARSMTSRSMPSPTPPVGGKPYSRAWT